MVDTKIGEAYKKARDLLDKREREKREANKLEDEVDAGCEECGHNEFRCTWGNYEVFGYCLQCGFKNSLHSG